MNEHRIFFIGLGSLGAQVLDLFVRVPGKLRFLVGGRNLEYLQQRTNLSLFTAMQLGSTPDIACTQIDLWNSEQTAEAIARFHPDLIFCAASLERWSIIHHLPQSLSEQLAHAQRGPLLPLNLSLVYKLMQAVQLTGQKTTVLNAIYPDVVNPVLSKVGLAPTTGIGDLANNIPAVRKTVARKLGIPVEQVEIYLVMSRYPSYWVSRKGNTGGAPFSLTALVNGEDLTSLLDMETIFDLLPTVYKRPGGATGRLMTAASATVVFEGMMRDTQTMTHVPGPNGLPGGYPVKVHAQGIEVVLPQNFSLKAALQINEAGLLFDGIENIDEQGTVSFAEREMSILKKWLGYECKHMLLSETEYRAKELQERYTVLARKYGA